MLPWDQLASLGAGGAVAVVILWVVFGFLEKKNKSVQNVLSGMQRTSDKSVLILEQQTKILEGLTHIVSDTRDKVIVIHSRGLASN